MEQGPAKPRIYQNHHFDSTRWRWFTPREDDIIIATAQKSGTTLMQTIVANLIFEDGNFPDAPLNLSPWLDARMMPLEIVLSQLDAQTHRRFIKTHLPRDGMPYHRAMKTLFVTRDPRDAFISLLNHWQHYTDAQYDLINTIPGRVGPPFPRFGGDIKTLWRDWITKPSFAGDIGGYPYWSHISNALTYWRARHEPNVRLFHFRDLITDLEGGMKEVAQFLEIAVPAATWPQLVRRSSFAEIKKAPEKIVGEKVSNIFVGGAATFIHKGTDGRWVGLLDEDDLALLETALAPLPDDFVRWLVRDAPGEKRPPATT
ncbi:MAG: sulfotransferase domain-containing protein [Pseudomonadota bacterium]